MENKKYTYKNYTKSCSVYQLILPLDIEVLIPEDDSVRLLSQILEEIDYRNLMNAYSHIGRNPVVSPKTLFKILVYAYMNNIYSTRDIETACRRDINFRWLLEGQPAPDHNTISRFRTERVSGVLEDLFYQFINKLGEMGEIDYKNIFIDGTKIEANANKYTFVWKKTTTKLEINLQEKLKLIIKTINEQFNKQYHQIDGKVEITELEEILDFLNKKKNEEKIEFVYGKGKRKTELQRTVEIIEDCLEKQQKYDEYNATFKDRNSFSKTDKDATFMHMKEDHMRNSQLKPGYNMQIGVEGEYIVGVDISSERSDQLTLIPFLNKLSKNLYKKYENIIADAGYESEENYEYLKSEVQNSYIKPQPYESMKKRSFKKNIGKRENMGYDKDNDEYICHNSKRLKHIYNTKRKSKSGYESEIKVYECESCDGCQYKSKCTKAKGNRLLQVSEKFVEMRNISLANITSEEGILLRMNRSIQVEGAFGVLKQDYGFRRFLTRGKKNVMTEFLFLCFGYDINKLHSKIQNDKCGVSFYKKKVA